VPHRARLHCHARHACKSRLHTGLDRIHLHKASKILTESARSSGLALQRCLEIRNIQNASSREPSLYTSIPGSCIEKNSTQNSPSPRCIAVALPNLVLCRIWPLRRPQGARRGEAVVLNCQLKAARSQVVGACGTAWDAPAPQEETMDISPCSPPSIDSTDRCPAEYLLRDAHSGPTLSR